MGLVGIICLSLAGLFAISLFFLVVFYFAINDGLCDPFEDDYGEE